MSKRGKQIKVNSFRNYSVKFGTIDDLNSQAVYLNISAWGQPKVKDELNYNRTVRDFNKKVKSNLHEILSNSDNNQISQENTKDLFLKERTIVDLDIKESGIKFNKRSFVNLDVTLFLSTELGINSKILQPKIDFITKNIINEVFDKNDSFKFYKKKK